VGSLLTRYKQPGAYIKPLKKRGHYIAFKADL